jgi:hypothetical protein
MGLFRGSKSVKVPPSTWVVELSTPNGNAGDTYIVPGYDVDDAIKAAKKSAPKNFTTVTCLSRPTSP